MIFQKIEFSIATKHAGQGENDFLKPFSPKTNAPLNYTLHHKLFECTVYTLNYDHCYTLHPRVSFTVKLDGNIKHMTCICVLLK